MRNLLLPVALGLGLVAAATAVHVEKKGNARLFPSGHKAALLQQVGQPFAGNQKARKADPRRVAEAKNIPWSIDFSSADLTGFTIIDANEDGDTWSLKNGEANAKYSARNQMDDWLITPALNMTGGHAYKLTFSAACQSSYFPEMLEVKYGTEPTAEAMNVVALQPTEIASTDMQEYTAVVVPRLSGEVYIGFHGISEADRYELRISKMSVTEGTEGNMPAGVRDLTVTSTDPYALDATIRFYAPETTMAGGTLTNISKITVSRDGEVIETINNPAPGAELSVSDTFTEGGEYTYTVCASNAAGNGPVMTVTHTVGGPAPSYPESVVLKELAPGVMHLEWSPVTTDINGKPIPAEFIRYIVVDSEMDEVARDLTETELTFSLTDNSRQSFTQMIVAAYTQGGVGEGVMSNLIAVGPAFTNWSESFPDGVISTLMGVGYEYGMVDNVNWDLANNTTITTLLEEPVLASDGDNGFAYMYCEYVDTGSSMFTGKVTLPASGAAVYFDIYNQSLVNLPDMNKVEVMVSEDNGFNWDTVYATTVFDLCGYEQGWHRQVVGLQKYSGKTVQIRWQVEAVMYPMFLIDNMKVDNLPDFDLKAEKFIIPETAAAGEQVSLKLNVMNLGAKAMDSYAVKLFVNDNEDKEIACGRIEPGDIVTVDIPYTISPVCDGQLNLRAEIACADADETNNASATLSITPTQSRYPYVSDLTGSADDNGNVHLSWSRPPVESASAATTEGFENGEDFTHEFGDWIFIDRDQHPIGNLTPSTIPGVETGVTKASFMVFNDECETFNQGMKAHGGHKYLAAVFAYDNSMTDDWAITPELNGSAQVVSFFARSLESYYPETMEIYYSMGSTNPDDFVLITKVDKVPGEWAEYNIPIPAGAKRFAVRGHTEAGMCLLLDDFYFADASVPTGLELEKYNVYCDGKAIASVDGNVTNYSYHGYEGKYTYAVTAVYAGLGESKSSNKVEIDNPKGISGVEAAASDNVKVYTDKGRILIKGLAGASYSVISTSGMTIASGRSADTATIPVAPGLYIVRTGNRSVKVAVR